MPSSLGRVTFRLRNGIQAFTAILLATVLSVSGLQYQAEALTLSNGICSADVNSTTNVAVYAEGNYCYVAFKGTTTAYQWTPPAGVSNIDLLVVAGGGGGGTRHAAGGGAGGLISTQSLSIDGSAMNITVGAGGAGATSSAWTGVAGGYPDPAAGQNSVVSGGGITTKTALGGGQGSSDANGGNGGSGGGSSCCGTSAGTGTSGQGNNGSAGISTSNFWAGGAGGGAGGLPTSPNSVTFAGARGGAGATVSWITSTAAAVGALSVGDISSNSVYFASGGGGGLTSGTPATAQPGGGSAGTAVQEGDVIDAKANTGGGGGGSGLSNSGSPAGGDGGSGVVVLRYFAQSYTVTFNYDGATGGNSNSTLSYNVGSGVPVTLPTPTKTNLSFKGWYSDAQKTVRVGSAGASYTPTGNTTLYAAWTSLLINLDAADSSSLTSTSTVWTSINPAASTPSGNIVNAIYSNVGGVPALSFTTSNSYVGFAQGTGNASGTMTLEAWVNPSSLTNSVWNIIASRWFTRTNYAGAVADWHFAMKRQSAGVYKLNLYTTNTNDVYGSYALSENTWYLVGFTINANNELQFFVNGVAVDTDIQGGTATGTALGNVTHTNYSEADLILGDHRTGAGMTGKISKFRIYNDSLTASEMLANFSAEGSTFGYSASTVTFNANDGSGSPATSTQSMMTGIASALTANTFTRTGYSFAGWATSPSGAVTYTNSQTVTLSAGLTLYAKWTANSNTVTFNANDGSGTPATSTQSITTDVATSLTANAFTRAGYSFGGWATSANGSVVYSNSQSVTLTSGLTLFAKWTASSNTVTFNANDGSGSPATSTQSIVSGTSTALTANSFTRTGYSFTGWNTAANGSGTAYANSAAVTILSSTTLYAQWTANTYTVTYNKNGASGNAERASESYTYGATAITLPTIGSMTKTGYTFDGWSETNGGTKISGTYTPTGSITLYARWVAASFSITYNDNAATSGSPSATSGSYTTAGTAITLATQSTMARTGYTFAGWSTTINDSTTRINNSGSYTITAPVILYALWTAVDYSVTYSTQDSTSGAAPTDATVFHIGDTAVVKANTGNLVKAGYTFAGWTVASDGSGTVLTSGDTVSIASSNVTLYPKWTANTYTVTLNLNGASGAPAGFSSGSAPFTESYTSGTSGLTLAAVGTMVKTGYDFAGWSTTPSGGAITNTGFTTTSDKTLYAVWNLKSINYSYLRGTAGGTTLTGSHIATFPSLSAQSGLYGSVINLDITVDSTITVGADGYQFMGWNDGNSIYSKGDAFTLGSSAATFTAEWVRLYEVRYAKNGGTGVVDVDPECAQAGNTCLANQNITLHVAPNRPGYTFTGWKDQNNQAFAAGAAATITSTSYLFYAQWQAIDYTMAFNSQGGSVAPSQLTKNVTDTFTLPSPGTKTGYTFSGWFDGTNTYGVGANYTVGTASKTFAALWTANVYTVTYNWNGGTGTAVPDVNYTFGTTAITLPTGSTHTRDGYTFAGWATSQGGSAISGGFTPTGDTLLYARWVDGSYTVTLNAHGGTLSQSSYSVSRGSSITLPAPTRAGFTFDGWYEDSATTLIAGQANTAFAPTATATLHAKWVQNSLAGVNPAHINSLTSITVTGAHTWSGTHSASGTGASLSIPNGALPNGTVVKVSFIEDLSRPRNIIDSSYAYYSSVIVHWLTGTGDSATVPVTAANKPLTLTMTNPAILPGARVFMIINGVATEAAEATQAGQVTIEISQDPEFVIAATKPSLPTSVIASAVTGSQATVSWAAPTSTGGAPITGYTVTASPGGATCSTTATLTCDVVGLTSGVSYSYSVVADNAIGSSGVRSTTVTYVPPAPTPVAPANTVPAAEVTPVSDLTRPADVVDEVAVVAEAEVLAEITEEATEEATEETTSYPVAERLRKGDTGIAAYVIGLGIAGGLLVLVLLGLLIMLMRRRSNS